MSSAIAEGIFVPRAVTRRDTLFNPHLADDLDSLYGDIFAQIEQVGWIEWLVQVSRSPLAHLWASSSRFPSETPLRKPLLAHHVGVTGPSAMQHLRRIEGLAIFTWKNYTHFSVRNWEQTVKATTER
ncbi:hypothetical protein AYO20_06355 [Fonsecaea nubica]|uniref:Uncharacterized protein n=1 Tax=Fonsecaea nubica TaxID=856822 RepID=A0A178CYG2_9EURO|nr:hypothetical protein AYO20_06355 [Fonsecaea nubica]OAL34302.1 hypothetical protein AYO20_06355 [Fonsecaea nubica]